MKKRTVYILGREPKIDIQDLFGFGCAGSFAVYGIEVNGTIFLYQNHRVGPGMWWTCHKLIRRAEEMEREKQLALPDYFTLYGVELIDSRIQGTGYPTESFEPQFK